MAALALVPLIALFLYMKDGKEKQAKELELKQPFNIRTALKFGLFFGLVIFVSKLAHITFGPIGLYLASIMSGLADVDAITLTMSSLSKLGEITPKVAVTAIILAASANTIVKAGMAWFLGERRFAKHIMIIFAIILALGLGSILIFF